MSKRYFGTDGIRGRVGEQPMSPDFVMRLGAAAGRVFAAEGRGKVLIGKDTRISGYMFESALEAGLAASGVDVRLLGPMPTPGVAYLTKTFRASAGVVISASHNPFHDNGVKFFDGNGGKLPDAVEAAIEAALEAPLQVVDVASLGKARRVSDAQGRYIEFCKATLDAGLSLRGLRVALDCAHGATYHVAPAVLTELGAEVVTMGVTPDGFNINDGCGSTAPARLQALVREARADVGIALDGDGDRVILVDDTGQVVNGDGILFVVATAAAARERLRGPVVGTVMSNLGLEQALAAAGIGFERAPVGDRHVLERLHQRGGVLGGEPSGHVICLDRTSTGDGIIAALQVLAVMMESGRSLRQLVAPLRHFPQIIENVAASREALGHRDVTAAVVAARSALGESGRVLLRLSGTEPVVRIMLEGADEPLIQHHAREIVAALTQAVTPRLR